MVLDACVVKGLVPSLAHGQWWKCIEVGLSDTKGMLSEDCGSLPCPLLHFPKVLCPVKAQILVNEYLDEMGVQRPRPLPSTGGISTSTSGFSVGSPKASAVVTSWLNLPPSPSCFLYSLTDISYVVALAWDSPTQSLFQQSNKTWSPSFHTSM